MLKSTGSILASQTQHCLGRGRDGQLGVLFPLCTSVMENTKILLAMIVKKCLLRVRCETKAMEFVLWFCNVGI